MTSNVSIAYRREWCKMAGADKIQGLRNRIKETNSKIQPSARLGRRGGIGLDYDYEHEHEHEKLDKTSRKHYERGAIDIPERAAYA